MPFLLLLLINQLRDQALNQILLGKDASLNYKKSYQQSSKKNSVVQKAYQ